MRSMSITALTGRNHSAWIVFLGVVVFVGCEECIMKTASVYAVKVSDSQQVVFPERCTACARLGSEMPVSMQVSDEQGRVDFYCYKFPVASAQGPQLTIPIHDSCARGVRNDFLKRLVLIILLAAGIAALGMCLHHGILGLTAAVIVATPLLYVQLMKPVPMEFYHYQHTYVLLFTNHEYAREFAWQNGASVEKCSYPYTGTPVIP
jgi:hypothetical protein